MDDQVIIDWYWERSEYAIVATKKKYGSYCHRVSYTILQNREDTEECLNDLYMKAWESIPPTRPLRLGAYLTKIVRNLALQRYFYLHSIQEIATTHQLGESHVKMTLKRTRDALQRALEAEGVRV